MEENSTSTVSGNAMSSSSSSSSAPSTNNNGNEEWANTWASLSTTAATLWKSAADATVDIVTNLQQEAPPSSGSASYNNSSNVVAGNISPIDRDLSSSSNPDDSQIAFSRSEHRNRNVKASESSNQKASGSSDDFFATFGV